ncbi:MAG: FAD-dependent oxidoreductase, partial [Planctomycetes bacterium]|nr:FAD-dependent oxidoreductase [Planctomycetota bacterium]
MYASRGIHAPQIVGSLLLLLMATGPASAAELIWIEAEHFADHGGWKLDAQFIDQMGSVYLLADGLGTPVEDARTTVDVPRATTYRLWVRTNDWLPEHHPGPFRVFLDGRVVEKTFGIGGRAGWLWEDGGSHELAGSIEVRLHDLAGFYGRCDAIVLSSDPGWVPPDEIEAIAELRREHGGLSAEVQDMPEHDVVVVGGGLAGCTAAVAAARSGASVVLIQNRPMLGGNASPEILVPPVGVWPHGKQGTGPLDPRETGLVEEYRTDGNQRVSEGKLYAKRLLRWVKLEANLDLFLNTHATGVEMAGNPDAPQRENSESPGAQQQVPPRNNSTAEIGTVLAMDVRTGRRMRFPGRLFIDCTGDAVIGVAAGAEYRQ